MFLLLSQTAHSGKTVTVLWVQLFQAQDHFLLICITDNIFLEQKIRAVEHVLTLSSNEDLLLDLVSVGVTEVDDSKRSTTAGVMDDVTNDTLKVKSEFVWV